MKARRAFRLERGRLWLTVEIVNFTDRDNACCIDEFLGAPGVEATPAFDNWLGFTPTFSVLWEF